MKKREASSDPERPTNAKVLHDLKAPLNMLTLHLELMRRRLASGEAGDLARIDESIGIMKQEIQRLDRMLHELLGETQQLLPTNDAAGDRPQAT